jgi:hypothetical protein
VEEICAGSAGSFVTRTENADSARDALSSSRWMRMARPAPTRRRNELEKVCALYGGFMKKVRTSIAFLLLGLILVVDSLAQQVTTARALFHLELTVLDLWMLLIVNTLTVLGIGTLCLRRTAGESK